MVEGRRQPAAGLRIAISMSVRGFTVERQNLDGKVVFDLRGELDLGAEAAFRRELEPAASAPTVVLDLSRLTFMDSTGLRLLLETDAQVRAAGGRCVIVRGTGAVHRVIAQGMLGSRPEGVAGPTRGT